ncbi:hypothetical protein L1887_40388 [Cichorium endivia]|nr:hypothetical protein L1887_40388 [Cichorium endivia]
MKIIFRRWKEFDMNYCTLNLSLYINSSLFIRYSSKFSAPSLITLYRQLTPCAPPYYSHTTTTVTTVCSY